MKTAEEFLKEKGIKDTLYDVKNPEPNNWIKGGLSALLDEYRNQSLSTTLPSDEEMVEEPTGKFILDNLPTSNTVNTGNGMYIHYSGVCQLLKKYGQAKLAEMEREMKESEISEDLLEIINVIQRTKDLYKDSRYSLSDRELESITELVDNYRRK